MRSPMHEIAALRQQLSLMKQRETEYREAINDFLDAWGVAVVNRKVEIRTPELPDELPRTYIFRFDDEAGDEWGDRGQTLLALVKTVTSIDEESEG